MYPNTEPVKGQLLLRIDAPLYFANVESVKDFIRASVAKSRLEYGDMGDRVR
jgi:hypothetical protein